MRGWLWVPVVAATAVASAWWWNRLAPGSGAAVPPATAEIRRGEMTVRAFYDGVVESRNVVSISSRFSGQATVVELAPEGAEVAAGDILARFDATEVEDEIRKLEQDRAIARAELRSLENARLPLELRELELELEDARRRLAEESSYLADSQALAKNRMLSEQEVARQQRKVLNLEAEVEKISLEARLTRDYLQPAALAKARTAVFTAEQALEVAREQLANSVIRAPRDGVVVYTPLSVGGEYRRIRIGDAIYPSQPFMVLPDMGDLVTVIEVPESELQNLALGAMSVIQPVAYPGLRLRGSVERIGAVAQSLPGRPDWQKFFNVVIGIGDRDARVRPGMSVVAEVVSYHVADVLLVPRRALRFEGDEAHVIVLKDAVPVNRDVVLGRHDTVHFVALEGLEEGDRVLLR